MKYVRTNGGIYKLIIIETPNGYHYQVHDLLGFKKELNDVYKDLINKFNYKSADTVEELSDCFIAVDKNGNLCENPMIAKGHCFKSFCDYYKANGIDVDCYLAILTDKGLIYVAKMNEDGVNYVLFN